MNAMLTDIEERIIDYLEKKSSKGKSFSLLFIAERLDPRNKLGFKEFETIFRKLEIDGTIYHNEDDDTWSLFPFEDGLVQGQVIKNEKGSCLINLEDGRKYIVNDVDSSKLLDGDIVVIKPTDKTSGSRIISDIDKIVKRKNALVLVEVIKNDDIYELKPINANIKFPISLPERDMYALEDGDQIFVELNRLNPAGFFEAKFVKRVSIDDKENNPKKIIKEKIKEILESPDKEDSSLDSYIKSIDNVKKEFDYENFTVKGIIKINKYGEGIVEANNKTYLIKRDFFGDALNGDYVEIRPSKLKSHGKIVSIVEEVLERKSGLVAIEVNQDKDGNVTLIPLNASIKHKLVLPEDFSKPLVVGDRLLVKIDKTLKKGAYEIEFVRALKHKDEPGADLSVLAAEYDIIEPFTEEEMAEANSLPTKVLDEEKVGRLDYTKKKVFSIDGARTKDRDDALSIEKLENGNYLVGIHIADVTHYIKPGMALWNAILERATSVYMADSVIPMLPHIISNGICSLNPGVDRLTLSCMVELTPQAEVVNFDFKDVVINSKKAMVYDDVNEILEDDITPEGYEDYVPELQMLHNLSTKLTEQRIDRGAINFDDIQNDTEIEYNDKGEAESFTVTRQRAAEKLIENFMLLAGKCYADYMAIPTTYRVHEKPDEEVVEDAYNTIQKLGVKVKSVKNIINGHALSSIIQSVEDQDLRSIVASILLQAQKRARIDIDEEIGHYALAYDKIGRFTSPIRRAEDAIGHYQLRKQRDNLYNSNNFAIEVKQDAEWIAQEANVINLKQYNAEQAEVAAIQLRMAQYIDKNIGKTFESKVMYVNEYGIYIKTYNGVLGKIDPYDYEDDILIYDEKSMSFRGKRSGIRIGIGSSILATALDTQREYRTINFGVNNRDCKRLTLKKGA